MKHKLINYGKKTKKLWVSAIVVLFVVAVAYSQIVKAQHGTDKVSSGTSYPGNGYWTGVSINGPWGTSTIYFTVTTDKTYSGNTFNDKSRPLYINVKQTNDNPYGMKILDTSPSTYRNASGKNYSWFNLKIGYTAHYYHSGEYFDTPSVTSAAHQVSNTAGHSSENHWVETTIRMSAYDTAVATYYDTSAKKYYRYHDCHVTLYLWGRNQYKVYYNGNGGGISESERTFNDGDNLTFPNAWREGYSLAGWRRDNDWGDWMGTGWVVCSTDYSAVAQWTAMMETEKILDGQQMGQQLMIRTLPLQTTVTQKKAMLLLDGVQINMQRQPIIRQVRRSHGRVLINYSYMQYGKKVDGNGASGSKKTENLAYGKDVQLPANSFQRAGYTFIGWSEDPDAIKPKYTDGQTVNTLCDAGQTYELYAIWKKSDGSFDLHNLIRDDAMFQGDVEIEGGNKTGS